MRPNTRQRSWSNYVGDRPIESRLGTDFYGDSSRYGPKADEIEEESDAPRTAPASEPSVSGDSDYERMRNRINARKERQNRQLSDYDKLQRDSSLRRGMNSLRDSTPVSSINPIV